MSADYTLWKPKTKEKFLLWTGYWNDILDLKDCQLQKLSITKQQLLKNLSSYYPSRTYGFIKSLAQRIIDFCGDDEIVLTNDCGKEYFSEDDVYNGIKDSYKVEDDRCLSEKN